MNSHEKDHEHRPFAEKLKHPFADLRQRLKGDVIPLLLLDPWYSPPTYTYIRILCTLLSTYVPSAEI